MPAGLSGAGYLALTIETTKGTYLPPTTAGTIFVPILSESFKYTEARYFSPQIRQSVTMSDVKQGYYHIEGDIELEVDCSNLPYWMYITRHTPSLAAGVYTFIPSQAGATSTAAGGSAAKTASITIVRNGVGFGYAGCVLGSFSFHIDAGILKLRGTLLGESDNVPGGLGTPTWSAPSLFGADASAIYTDTAGIAPGFAAAAEVDWNGYTFTANHNAEAQNRIVRNRSASYVKYGETEITMETELDFINRTEYNNFVATTQKAFRLEALTSGAASFAAATEGVQIDVNRGVYETYDLGLSGLGDTIMAGVTARGIGITGGPQYKIKVKSAVTVP